MDNNNLERRGFLKFALGITAGAGLVAVTANSAFAAPLMLPADVKGPTPQPRQPEMAAQPAVADEQDLGKAQVEQVQYGYRRRRRYFAPRRRYFRRRYRRFY